MFVAELRALAQTCNFGDTFHAQRSSGVRDGRRFHSATVTRRAYKRALELALGLEMAAKNARELQTTAASGQAVVHKLSMSSTSQVTGAVTACWR